MPQVLKPEVRERIRRSALEVFAARGYLGASMALIAEHAGVGTAGVYRYYASKDELFDAVVAQDLADQFEALLERRVRALGKITLGGEHGDDHGDELLQFWIAHRLAVVILLDRAAGTRYDRYGERFVELLVEATVREIRAAHAGVRIHAPARFVLQRIFENTRRMLAAILESHEDERALREAMAGFWSYQIAGLRGFAAWVRVR